MLLADVEAKLKELDENVYYGMVDESANETAWNYIVFNRDTVRLNNNKTSASDYFSVHIIRENYIPEGFDTVVIDKLCTLAGVRTAGSDFSFTYVQKPNTNIVVEMLTIPFVRARSA